MKQRLEKFLDWWKSPITKKDRITGAFVGSFAGFWIGALGRIALSDLPVAFKVVAMWGLAGAVIFSLLGVMFPKVISCICFPFSIFGIGNT